jgi:hypothetical protein
LFIDGKKVGAGSVEMTAATSERIVADCGVSVRIAWPHLPKNPPDYDKQMEAVLSSFLTSVGPI